MDEPRTLDERCEDAVFVVCDVRERYPARCADELAKYLLLQNDNALKPILLKPMPRLPEIQQMIDKEARTEIGETFQNSRTQQQWNNVIDSIHELKIALKQLEDNKNFEIKYKLLT